MPSWSVYAYNRGRLGRQAVIVSDEGTSLGLRAEMERTGHDLLWRGAPSWLEAQRAVEAGELLDQDGNRVEAFQRPCQRCHHYRPTINIQGRRWLCDHCAEEDHHDRY